MKKLLFAVAMSTIFFTSCDKQSIEAPEIITINNNGLPSIKANEYYLAEVETSTKLAVGTKITKGTYTFNIVEYKDGMLELKLHQICSGLNPSIRSDYSISCGSYKVIKFTIQKCNP